MEPCTALEVGAGLQTVVPLAVAPPLSRTMATQDVHLGAQRLKVRRSRGAHVEAPVRCEGW